jgi:quercetin dioxygenase-like cupin family protein
MRVLRVVSGPSTGRSLAFHRDVVIGRAGSDLELEDPEVSRRHAVLHVTGDGVVVEDLNSRNGTFVNGTSVIEPTPITLTDVLSLGNSELRIEVSAQQTVMSPAPPLGSQPAHAYEGPAGLSERDNELVARLRDRRAWRAPKIIAPLAVAGALIGAGIGIGLWIAPEETTGKAPLATGAAAPKPAGPSGASVAPVLAKYVGAGFLSATSQLTGAPVAAGAVTRDLGGGTKVGVAITGHPFVVLARLTIQPGAQTGWHIHPRGLDGFIMVTQGRITFYVVNDPHCRPHPLFPGQVMFISGTLAHDVRNEGHTPATLYALSMFGRPVQPQTAFLPRPRNPACRF